MKQTTGDVRDLCRKQALSALWEQIGGEWELLLQIQIAVLIASYEEVGIPAGELLQLTGAGRSMLPLLLEELLRDGVIQTVGGKNPRYAIAGQRQFLAFLDRQAFRLGVSAGHLSILARWASR